MPRTLRKVRWREELLDIVQFFDFGDEPWEREIADWIKSANNEERTRPDTDTWVYVSDDDRLVGYAALCPSRWRWPEPKSPSTAINIVPALGIHREFWGEPRGEGERRYSDQIMDDLIAEALKHPDRGYLLGLYVHSHTNRA